MFYHLSVKSSNRKTGPIPTTISGKESCPDVCPFKKNGCYAASGPLNHAWLKVTNGQWGLTFSEFTKKLAELPENTLGRLNQAGDVPGKGNRINGKKLSKLTKVLAGKRFFGYTHKLVTGDSYVANKNRKHIKYANKNGLTINLSANNLKHADKLKALNIGPVVTVLPDDAPPVNYTPKGHKVITCPAQIRDDITCQTCRLCQKQRGVIVGFLAHSVAKRFVNEIAKA